LKEKSDMYDELKKIYTTIHLGVCHELITRKRYRAKVDNSCSRWSENRVGRAERKSLKASFFYYILYVDKIELINICTERHDKEWEK